MKLEVTLDGGYVKEGLIHKIGQELSKLKGKYVIRADKPVRSTEQNRALHKWCSMVAEALNESGNPHEYPSMFTPGKTVKVPWTMDLFKNLCWKPMQKHLVKKESTTKLTTAEVNDVFEPLAQMIEQKTGMYIDFPHRE